MRLVEIRVVSIFMTLLHYGSERTVTHLCCMSNISAYLTIKLTLTSTFFFVYCKFMLVLVLA